MFDAIVIVALLLTACVVGLIHDHRQARRIDERIAVLKTALKLSQDLDRNMNERAAQFREAHHV